MLNDAKIIEYFEKEAALNSDDCNYFYGQVLASVGARILLANNAILVGKHYIISLNKKELVMISMTLLGELQDYTTINSNDIQGFKISKWLFSGYNISIFLRDASTIKFRVIKTNGGLFNHKENLKKAISIMENWQG